jgi:hypothetical protein
MCVHFLKCVAFRMDILLLLEPFTLDFYKLTITRMIYLVVAVYINWRMMLQGFGGVGERTVPKVGT